MVRAAAIESQPHRAAAHLQPALAPGLQALRPVQTQFTRHRAQHLLCRWLMQNHHSLLFVAACNSKPPCQ
jgi:hypothetical protein